MHLAAMQPGEASLAEVTALLNAHPGGATEKDNVRGTHPFSHP